MFGGYACICICNVIRPRCAMCFSSGSQDKCEGEQAGLALPEIRTCHGAVSVCLSYYSSLASRTDRRKRREKPRPGPIARRAEGKEETGKHNTPHGKFCFCSTHIQKKSTPNRLKGLKYQKRTLKLLVENVDNF